MPRYSTLILAITLIFAAAAFASEYTGDAGFVRKYASAGGEVTFPHGLHASKLSTTCNACHSALRTFGGISQIYGHKYCKFCHESNNGPTECGACHNSAKTALKN